MKIKKSLIVFSCAGILGAALFFNSSLANNLFSSNEPEPRKEAALMRALLDGLQRMHFQPRAVDDKLSRDVYDFYLNEIDGSKRFFTQADIKMMEAYREQLDEQANAGTFEFFNVSITLLDRSLEKTQGWYRDILSKPFDFSTNESVEMDGKKVKWAENDAALRRRIELLLKYDVLSRVIEEEDKQNKADFKGDKKTFAQLEEDARKKVLDNYDKWYKRMMKMNRSKRMEIYLNAFTNCFDPHTGYYSPREKENFDIQMSGKLEGIGARLQSDGEKTTVNEIVVGGPAWKQGDLQAKDVILKVAQANEEPVDVMGFEIDDVVSKVRGPKGTVVTLTVQKPDGAIKEITITRDVVVMEEGFAKSLLLNSEGSTDKVGYIYLPKFYADFTAQGVTSCYEDVKKEIAKQKEAGAKGIILDLRNNGGGSLRDVVQMSGLFVENGPMVQVKSRTRKPEINEDNDPRVHWGGPLVVMVNGFSASASEILAAAMQDYGRAVIVGSSGTYGKGTVQRFLDLDNMTSDESVKPLGEMKLTVQKFYRVTGKTTQLDGVTPDIVLPDFYNLLENGEGENEHPLDANTIDPVYFGQQTYRIADMKGLKSASEARVSKDPTFQKINENAQRLRKMKDQSSYVLNVDKYRQWNKRQDEESAKYDDMFKPIDGFVVENLGTDLAQIMSDTSRVARNDNWIKERKKDIQLYETLRIMQDMIRMDAVAQGKN